MTDRGSGRRPEPGSARPASTGKTPAQRRHRILHVRRNVRGVLSRMHGLIADLGANISAEYLQTNDCIGYVVLDVDPSDGQAIAKGLRQIPETIRLRVLW